MGLLAGLPELPVDLNLPPIGQIGVVVRDIKTAVERYSQVCGIDSWTIKETNAPPFASSIR